MLLKIKNLTAKERERLNEFNEILSVLREQVDVCFNRMARILEVYGNLNYSLEEKEEKIKNTVLLFQDEIERIGFKNPDMNVSAKIKNPVLLRKMALAKGDMNVEK